MQNGCGCVNINVRKLHIVRSCEKQITMIITSHHYSLQECVFLLSTYYRYSSKYEFIFNNYQEKFLNSPISRCEMV